MSKSIELLQECMIKHGFKTQYQLAKAMDMHRGTLNAYFKEKQVPDEYACIKIALLLQRDPTEIIAIVQADTEKNEKRAGFWRDFLARVQSGGRLFTLAVIFGASLLGGLHTSAGSGFRRPRHFA